MSPPHFNTDGDPQSGTRTPRRNPTAVASIVLAFISLALMFSLLMGLLNVPVFWLASVPAIIFGHLALGEIQRGTRDALNRGMARGGLWMGYFITFLPILEILPYPRGHHIQEKGNQAKAINNCRQIDITLHLYSADHDGKYPDAALPEARSSNAVFRRMFVDGEADNEVIFSSPASQYFSDGNIGTAPAYQEALQPGENHWAMTKGLTEKSDGSIPLVYENPTNATWPPRWSPDLVGTGKPGRTWTGGKIIVGFNDGSVSLLPLEATSGRHVGLKPKADGSPVFPKLEPKPVILQVESK